MRTVRTLAAAVGLSLVAALAPATTARAADSVGFTMSTQSGSAGTVVTVTSSAPCGTVPAGDAAGEVDLTLTPPTFASAGGSAVVTPKADGSWTANLTVASADRNGA